jgi:leucyl aminopeptidase
MTKGNLIIMPQEASMNIQLVTWTPLERECALVIFTNVACPKITTDDESTLPLFKVVSQIAGTESHQRLFEGKLGQALCYRENAQIGGRVLIFIGLTKVGLAESERFRRGAAYAFSALQNEKVIKAAIYLAEDSSGNFCQPIAEGLTLSSYQMAEFKRAAAASNVVIKEISIVSPESDIKNGEIRTGKIVADATNFARRIGDLPPNLLTPTTFCKLTQNEIGNLPVQYEEWNPERLAAEKMEGLLNVSKGSAEEARMLILRYEGTTKENNPLCLVGKGITFDSGGLDLKSAKNMESMRFDMCGAAAS